MNINLNYKINKQNERIEITNQEIEKNIVFLDHYFHNNFNFSPSKTEPLSSDDDICQQLEKIANYILFSPDAERITKKTEYNFYTEDKINKKQKKEVDISDKSDEVIDFFIRKGANYKKQIKQVINKNDLEIKEIKEYNDATYDYKNKLNKLRLKNKNYKLQKQLAYHLKLNKQDQLYCKDVLRGTIYFKDILPDSTVIDYDMFDFFNKEHVLALLKFSSGNLNTDLGILVHDLNELIKQMPLSPTELEILKLYRVEDMTHENIAFALGVSQQYISATINRMCEKIIDKFKEVYEDWYYLNIVRGRYKKCSRCGEIKIANERYFWKNSNTKDGLYSSCKKCSNSE